MEFSPLINTLEGCPGDFDKINTSMRRHRSALEIEYAFVWRKSRVAIKNLNVRCLHRRKQLFSVFFFVSPLAFDFRRLSKVKSYGKVVLFLRMNED